MAVFSWRLSVPAELRPDPAHDMQQCQQKLCSCAMFRHSHPGMGRGLCQAVFTHSQTCFCLSDQLMLLNCPDLLCSHLTSCFSPPLVVFQLPYLTARGAPRRRASSQPRRRAAPTTFSRGRLGECLWGQARESTSLSASEKKLPTHKHSYGECFPCAP